MSFCIYVISLLRVSSSEFLYVSIPDLAGCITCGETVESAVANALDAKRAWLEAALEAGIEIHEPDSLENYSGQFKLRIPRSLHRALEMLCKDFEEYKEQRRNGNILAIENQ